MHSSHTYNFRLLLCHFFFRNEPLFSLLFLSLPWEMGVSQELFDEFRTVQIVLWFPCVFCTVYVSKKEVRIPFKIMRKNPNISQHENRKLIQQHLTHSVKPFHFRKYSTLPLKILRRIIFSTTNSWTTAVSSVFLCLAVCFFLILSRMRRKQPNEQACNYQQGTIRSTWKQNIKCFCPLIIIIILNLFVKTPQWCQKSTLSSPCCWDSYLHFNMAVVCTLPCPSDNDPYTYYSAPPAVSFGSTTCSSFGPKRNTLLSTHVHSSFTLFSWEIIAQTAAWKHERKCAWVMHKNNMHVRFRCLLNLGGQPAAVLLGSVWSLSLETTCTQRPRCRFVRKFDVRRVYMSETTFHEWVKIKDGRGCSEEVVAKGKGHARKTGRRRRGRAQRRPIREQSARPSPQSSGPEQPCHPRASAGYGRRLGALGMSHWDQRVILDLWFSDPLCCRWKRICWIFGSKAA